MEEHTKLDLKDKKLLYEIDMDARMTYSQLGKKVGLSKQGAEYKLNNLMKKGIVKGFYPVINVTKLGYMYCRFFLSLQNASKEKEQEIINYFKKNNKFIWVFTSQGIYDVLAAILVKSVGEFYDEINNFLDKFGQYVRSKNFSFTTDVIHYQHRYLIDLKETEEIHTREESERVDLNDKEKAVLKALTLDARMPITKIADKIKTSDKVAAYTLRKLEKEGIIQGYRPIIDHNKLGFAYYKLFINLNYYSKKDVEKLYQDLRDNPIVIYVVKGLGFEGDLDVEVMVKNNLELFNFIKELKERFPKLIGDYKTFMFINAEKTRFLPF